MEHCVHTLSTRIILCYSNRFFATSSSWAVEQETGFYLELDCQSNDLRNTRLRRVFFYCLGFGGHSDFPLEEFYGSIRVDPSINLPSINLGVNSKKFTLNEVKRDKLSLHRAKRKVYIEERSDKMRLVIKGSKFATQFVKSYIRQKFLKFGKILPASSLFEITLDEKKKGEKKQISLNLEIPGQKKLIHIEEISFSWQTSIDLAKERLEKSIRRMREKRISFFKRIGKRVFKK